MNIAQIEKNLSELVMNISPNEFIYDLLLAYGTPKTTVTLLKKGKRNLSKKDGQIILKRKLFFQETGELDLHGLIDSLKKDDATYRHDPRFIIVTDYKTLLAIDTKTDDTLDIKIEELNKYPFFFGPWAKIEKNTHYNEQEADVKAAEKMAKIYDEILKDNHFKTHHELHGLNAFLSRLLFCYFAEDTGIFAENSFTNGISFYTQEDGSDLDEYLNKLFEVLNTSDHSNYPDYLAKFPYVNGGLFGDLYFVPKFSPKARRMIIECGELDWATINPDIFGSMFQAVVHKDQRSNMGQHYTSVPNIMKVIEPLFLNEIREEFEKAYNNKISLEKLLGRLTKIRIFDPACGSGNFLIIAYKELRELEMEIWIRRCELAHLNYSTAKSFIKLSQFYGIELDDFAHEIAILSLWLAEHQMNVKFKEVFGQTNPTLPLKEGGNIVCGNATRISWEDVCPKDKNSEIYILGNPPYLGTRNQKKPQKDDMAFVFEGIAKYKNLDYISCWLYKGANYIRNLNSKLAFVSTNSICQGDQVALLWPELLKDNLEIGFAHTSFKWTNNAKGNAGVTCIIVSLQNCFAAKKILFINTVSQSVEEINPYLAAAPTIYINRRSEPISELPQMLYGNEPRENGHLMLDIFEKEDLLEKFPQAEKFIKPVTGSREFINGIGRWCLWIKNSDLDEAKNIPEIQDRLLKVAEYRKTSSRDDTVKFAAYPNCFTSITHKEAPSIIVPVVSSERREYIPMDYLDGSKIVLNSAHVIYDAEPWVFGVVNSKIHMVWVKTTAGALETRIRYSSAICYNNFPLPQLTEKQKETITMHVYNVLEEREKHSEKTMAELYDPDEMPDGLKEAHHHLNLAVERCYRSQPFTSDEERLKYLFKLYEAMISKEKA